MKCFRYIEYRLTLWNNVEGKCEVCYKVFDKYTGYWVYDTNDSYTSNMKTHYFVCSVECAQMWILQNL